MKTINYKVNRDQVYVGSVLNITKNNRVEIHDGSASMIFNRIPESQKENLMECHGHLYTHNPHVHITYINRQFEQTLYGKTYGRTMLFATDENKYADDLLFDTPNYPIVNISRNEDCINKPFLINRCFNFGKILRYYEYPEILEFSDLKQIEEYFFRDGDYILDNCELFGIKESDQFSDKATYDSKGRLRDFSNTVEHYLKIQAYSKGIDPSTLNDEIKTVFDECYFNDWWMCGRYPLMPDENIEKNVKRLCLK